MSLSRTVHIVSLIIFSPDALTFSKDSMDDDNSECSGSVWWLSGHPFSQMENKADIFKQGLIYKIVIDLLDAWRKWMCVLTTS